MANRAIGMAIVKPSCPIIASDPQTEGWGLRFILIIPSVFSHYYSNRIIAHGTILLQQLINWERGNVPFPDLKKLLGRTGKIEHCTAKYRSTIDLSKTTRRTSQLSLLCLIRSLLICILNLYAFVLIFCCC